MANIWLPGDGDLALALREPNLSASNRLPTEQVRINWLNPLWRGLALCWVAGQRVNLVDGKAPTQDGTTIVGSQFGGVASFTESATGNIYWDDEYLTTSDGAGQGDMAIVVRANPTSQSDIEFLAGQKWDPDGSPYTQVFLGANTSATITTLAGSLAFVAYSNDDQGVAQASKIDGEWHTFFGGRTGTTMYVQRDLESTTSSSKPLLDVSDGNRKTLIGNGGKGSATDCYQDEQSIVLMFNRHVTESERAEIHRILTSDLKQLLVPANSAPFLIGLPGGATAPTLSLPGVTNVQATQATPQVTLAF